MEDENMGEDVIQPQESNNDQKNGLDENEENDNCNEQEFEAINAQLDQLNFALDTLERKNDDIYAELVELLKSNREVRKQFQEPQKEDKQESEKPNP